MNRLQKHLFLHDNSDLPNGCHFRCRNDAFLSRHFVTRDLSLTTHLDPLGRGPTVGVTNPFSMTTDEGQGLWITMRSQKIVWFGIHYVSLCNLFVIKMGGFWSEGIWKENMAYKSEGQQKTAGDPLSNMRPRIVCLRHVSWVRRWLVFDDAMA